jgi:DNA-binding HxlR family transcriptional regulator
MKWDDLDAQPCSVARTLAVIGDRWTLMILRDCFLGARRFDEFQARLGLSRALLAGRLRQLTEAGVLERRVYQTRPDRHEYRLTPAGLDLHPVIIGLADWGNRHLGDERGPPLLHRHKSCDHDFHPVTACSHCGEAIDPRAVAVRPGPGFPDPRVSRAPGPASPDRASLPSGR